MSKLVLSVLKLNLAIPINEEQKRFWRILALSLERVFSFISLNTFQMQRSSFMEICSFLMGTVTDEKIAESFFTHYTSEGIWNFTGKACFDHIWKRALGNGDKSVAIVSLLKTARAIEKESLEIRNFIKSQIAIGRLSKKLGSSDQIMTIWARSTNEFADPFTPEAATLISEQRMGAHQQFVLKQIIKSELFLRSKLGLLLSDYATPLGPILAPEIHKSFFGEIARLQTINASLLDKLEKQLKIDTNIGPIFMQFARNLKGFMTYFQNSVAHTLHLKELNDSKAFRNFFKKTPKVSARDLQALLSVPLQHIRKYGLQLQEQLQWTPCRTRQANLQIQLDDDGNCSFFDPKSKAKIGFKDRNVNGKRFLMVVTDTPAVEYILQSPRPEASQEDALRMGDNIIAVDQDATSTFAEFQRKVEQALEENTKEISVVYERYRDMSEALEVVTQSVQEINDGMEAGQRRHMRDLFERVSQTSGEDMVMLGYDLLASSVVTSYADKSSGSGVPSKSHGRRKKKHRLASIDTGQMKLRAEPPQEVRRVVIFTSHFVLTTMGEDNVERIEAKNVHPLPFKEMFFNKQRGTITFKLVPSDLSQPVQFVLSVTPAKKNVSFSCDSIASLPSAGNSSGPSSPGIFRQTSTASTGEPVSEQFVALEQQLNADCWHVVDGVPYATVPDLIYHRTPSVESLRRVTRDHYYEKDAKLRGLRFDTILKAFPVIWTQQHASFLRGIYCDKRYFEVLSERTNVYTFEQFGTDALKHVVTCLATPRPPLVTDANCAAVMHAVGFDPTRPPNIIPNSPKKRTISRRMANRHEQPPFVVGGPVVLNVNGRPDPFFEQRNLCVVHAEALNFSTTETLAYLTLYEKKSDERFRSIVRGRLRMMFHLCFQAAKDLGCDSICVPAVGLGDFLNACDKKRAQVIEDEFVAQLLWANANCPYVHLSPRFPHSDKMDGLDILKSIKGDNVCLVNPVDFQGFIGDGGGLSERMVNATAEAEGQGACNSALMHNALFNARLLSPENYKYYPLDSVRTDAVGVATVEKEWKRFLLVYHATSRHPTLSKGYNYKLGHDYEGLITEFNGLECVCCKRLVRLNLREPFRTKLASKTGTMCIHVDGKKIGKHLDKALMTMMLKSVQTLSIPRIVKEQDFDSQAFFNIQRGKRYQASVDYFMGGEDRLAALRQMFQTCSTVSKEGGAASQLRIITHSDWADVFKLMNIVKLAEHVHSLWDSTGSGILAASGKTIGGDHIECENIDLVALWARELAVNYVVYVEDMTDTAYDRFLMAKDGFSFIDNSLSTDLASQLQHVLTEARKAQKLFAAQQVDPEATSPQEDPVCQTPRGRHLREKSAFSRRDSLTRIISQRISTDYSAIGTNETGTFAMHVERLLYESGGMSADIMSKVEGLVKEQMKSGNSVLVVLDFDCTVTHKHWAKTFYSPDKTYRNDFKTWRDSIPESPKVVAHKSDKAAQLSKSSNDVFESF